MPTPYQFAVGGQTDKRLPLPTRTGGPCWRECGTGCGAPSVPAPSCAGPCSEFQPRCPPAAPGRGLQPQGLCTAVPLLEHCFPLQPQPASSLVPTPLTHGMPPLLIPWLVQPPPMNVSSVRTRLSPAPGAGLPSTQLWSGTWVMGIPSPQSRPHPPRDTLPDSRRVRGQQDLLLAALAVVQQGHLEGVRHGGAAVAASRQRELCGLHLVDLDVAHLGVVLDQEAVLTAGTGGGSDAAGVGGQPGYLVHPGPHSIQGQAARRQLSRVAPPDSQHAEKSPQSWWPGGAGPGVQAGARAPGHVGAGGAPHTPRKWRVCPRECQAAGQLPPRPPASCPRGCSCRPLHTAEPHCLVPRGGAHLFFLVISRTSLNRKR